MKKTINEILKANKGDFKRVYIWLNEDILYLQLTNDIDKIPFEFTNYKVSDFTINNRNGTLDIYIDVDYFKNKFKI